MNNRVEYIDISKAIAIIFVIIGHTFTGMPWVIANSFHMILFFLVSGYFFKITDEHMLIKKIGKRLCKPYILTCIGFIIYYMFIKDLISAKQWIWGAIYGSGYDYNIPFFIKGVGGIWFFWPCLMLKLS